MHVEETMPASFVDKIASKETRRPVGGIQGRLRENLMKGKELMNSAVYGQEQMINPIVDSLQRAAAGLNDPNRPLGVFLLPGPPGSGKSYTGEMLAVKLFGSREFFASIDMENYQEKHTVSRLIGAPPGYADSDKKALLVEIVENMPFGVLLLDEIEKAHPDVRQALLKARGTGIFTALNGETADMRNLVIIETTNYGQKIWLNNDFETGQQLVINQMKNDPNVFSPEYLDRTDGIHCASPLDTQALANIARDAISNLQDASYRKHPDLHINVGEEDIRAFTENHLAGKSGRAAKRAMNQILGDPLTKIKLSDDKASGIFEARYNPEHAMFEFVLQPPEGPTQQIKYNNGLTTDFQLVGA
jgi:ATP-dependent Clp protease ATP-binding subunit ClpA